MSLRIARLRLRLPAGYAPRAEAIARALAESASRVALAESRSIERLALAPIRVAPGASDADVVGAAARGLAEGVGGKR